MSEDPGTIYSDDERDDVCESDGEIEGDSFFTNEDNFFEDLKEQDRNTEYELPEEYPYHPEEVASDLSEDELCEEHSENAGEKKVNYLKGYLDKKKKGFDVNDVIERVRKKVKKQDNVPLDIASDDDEVCQSEWDEEGNKNEGTVKLRFADIKKKENKRERVAIQAKERLEKEKEKIGFEDAPPFTPGCTFLEMNLSSPILKAISKINYEMPTQIQAMTIPIALKGRDICGCAATGTGKTAAFMIPILQRLLLKPCTKAVTRTLVLVPTRELGVQVFEVSKQLAQYSNITISLTVGGLNREMQIEELVKRPDIVIATPGRLIDHMHNAESFSLADIEILVVDEADRILDEFFTEQLTEIVRQCRITRQTMLFSATMTEEVKELVTVSLKKPVRIFANTNTDITQNLRQEFVRLRENTEESRMAVLAHLLTKYFREECIVFIPKRETCHRMHIKFGLLGLKCGELHGLLKQPDRLDSLEKFRKKDVDILFATDLASRGLDIKGVKTVINFEVPPTYKIYVHRVGRTARAGFSGRSVTLAYECGPDYSMLRKIKKYSMFPLYERCIKRKIIESYIMKLDSLEPSLEEVLQLETEEKMKEAEKAVAYVSEKVVTTNCTPTQKKGKRTKTHTFEQQPPNRAQRSGKNTTWNKEGTKTITSKKGKLEPDQNRKRNTKKGDGIETASSVCATLKRKSNFDKELTQLDVRSKKLTLANMKREFKKIRPIY